MPILVFYVLALIAVIVGVLIYIKTKSFKKIGYFFEIILSLFVLYLSIDLPRLTSADISLLWIVILLGVGLLINGAVSFLKK